MVGWVHQAWAFQGVVKLQVMGILGLPNTEPGLEAENNRSGKQNRLTTATKPNCNTSLTVLCFP